MGQDCENYYQRLRKHLYIYIWLLPRHESCPIKNSQKPFSKLIINSSIIGWKMLFTWLAIPIKLPSAQRNRIPVVDISLFHSGTAFRWQEGAATRLGHPCSDPAPPSALYPPFLHLNLHRFSHALIFDARGELLHADQLAIFLLRGDEALSKDLSFPKRFSF